MFEAVAPPPIFTAPVTFKPVVLFSVNAPLLVNAPRLAMAFAPPKFTVPPALPLRVPALAVIMPTGP